MLAQGYDPLSTYQALFQFSLFGLYPLSTTIKNSVPLILTGLSASVAFASGPVNLGQPGQLVMGALFASVGGIYLHLPPGLEITVLLGLAMIGGALWSGVAALLRQAFNMSEFIVTLMLNMIADFFTAWVIAFHGNNGTLVVRDYKTGKKPDVLALTGDHSTPCAMKGHSWHPEPVLLHSACSGWDKLERFTETGANSGSLGIFPAKDLIRLMQANAKMFDKFGA